MWEKFRLSAVGSVTLRNIAPALVAGIVSALFLVVTNSHSAFADSGSWNGDSIIYAGNTYVLASPAPTLPAVPRDWNVYTFRPNGAQTISVIAVSANADKTKDITDAKYYIYQYDDASQVYSDPSPPDGQTITISASTDTNGNGNGDATNKNQTSCAVTGVGWIICSVSRWIADGMDHVFDLISNYLTVRPLTTDTSSGLYQAWAIARGLANGAFIIAFLIIIYSQITNYGISNYEIKKMIPRLIIAAILVNISYYICTLAVDVSNILGDSIEKALMQIREALPAPMPGGSVVNWKNLTDFLLSGGTLTGAVFAGYAAFTGGTAAAGSITSLVILLFPILVAGILSVLVALIVLAARQALITVLVILSPLAFVAYLLPNTEKLFERWRKMLTTMLMVFPMFSLLFGGSQLASYLIIQNTNQISVLLLAMFVQVAPLALTPFLVRFSGSLLGQLAGMLNKPKGALVGRAKNWATDRAEAQAAKGQVAAAKGRGSQFQRRALLRNLEKKDRESWKKLGETYTDAVWHNDPRYRRHHAATSRAEIIQKAGETSATREFEEHKAHDRNLQNLTGRARQNEDATKMMQAREEARWEEARTGRINPQTHPREAFSRYAAESNEIFREQRIADSNTAIAKALQSRDYATELGNDANVELQLRAGGNVDKLGKIKVKSSALTEVIKAGAENVEHIKTASYVKAGDITNMRLEFDRAVAANDVDSLRAYADMLGNSKDPGIKELRKALNDHHDTIKASDMHETFMHFINGNRTINESAKDIGDYSRDVEKGYRKLSELSASPGTWRNMDAMQFSGQKSSSQKEALKARDDQGNWAISRSTAVQIMNSTPAWANIKADMKPLIWARAAGKLGIKPNGELFSYPTKDLITDPPEQQIPDDKVPPAP
ncbi:MAG TPA: hypothetical protein VMT96_00835 [Candidatus Bathyarchaeia archaeon]|nr:hypothetical protein [Candidatus Bathyarchaeia archaeon]